MSDQIDRLVSDAESEKNGRRMHNAAVNKRIADLELWQAKWAGALAAFSILALALSIMAVLISLTKK